MSFATNAVDIGKPNACALLPAPPVRTPIAIGRQGVQGNGLTGAGSGKRTTFMRSWRGGGFMVGFVSIQDPHKAGSWSQCSVYREVA